MTDVDQMDWDVIGKIQSAKGQLQVRQIKGNLREFDRKLGLRQQSHADLSPAQLMIRLICDLQNLGPRERSHKLEGENSPYVFIGPALSSELRSMLKDNSFFLGERDGQLSGVCLKPYHVIVHSEIESVISTLLQPIENYQDYQLCRPLKLQPHASETTWEVKLHKQTGEGAIQVEWGQATISDDQHPAIQRWNRENPQLKIQRGDVLRAANGCHHADNMMQRIFDFDGKQNGSIVLHLLRKCELSRPAISHVTSQEIRLPFSAPVISHVCPEEAWSPLPTAGSEPPAMDCTLSDKSYIRSVVSRASHMTRSTGAKPTVPEGPGRDRWDHEAGGTFELPIARKRDYGPTNSFSERMPRLPKRADATNPGNSVNALSPDSSSDTADFAGGGAGSDHGGHRGSSPSDASQTEGRPGETCDEPSGNRSGATPINNCSKEECAQSVASEAPSLPETLRSAEIGEFLDVFEFNLKCPELEEDTSDHGRWKLFVEAVIMKWAESHLPADRTTEPCDDPTKQRFRDATSSMIRQCLELKYLKRVFPLGNDSSSLPLAKTFKRLFNEDHDCWNEELLTVSADSKREWILSRLSGVLMQVYSEAVAARTSDHQRKEQAKTHIITPCVQTGSKKASARFELGTIPESGPGFKQAVWKTEAQPRDGAGTYGMGKFLYRSGNPGLKDRHILNPATGEGPARPAKTQSASAALRQIVGKPGKAMRWT